MAMMVAKMTPEQVLGPSVTIQVNSCVRNGPYLGLSLRTVEVHLTALTENLNANASGE